MPVLNKTLAAGERLRVIGQARSVKVAAMAGPVSISLNGESGRALERFDALATAGFCVLASEAFASITVENAAGASNAVEIWTSEGELR